MTFLLAVCVLAGLATAAPGSICSQNPYRLILPLSNNAFVKSYCSSSYPLPVVTSTTATNYTTITVPTTVTTTMSTTTFPLVVVSQVYNTTLTTTKGEASTQTITTTSTTTLSTTVTSTSTSTSSYVTDGSGNHYKRAADVTSAPAELVGMCPIWHDKLEPNAIAVRAAGGGRFHLYKQNKRVVAAASAYSCFVKRANYTTNVASTACSCIETPLTANVSASSWLEDPH